MTRFSQAATLLALTAAATTANAQKIEGGFQSGPSHGAFYAGGMHYIHKINRAFFTGSHYNKGIVPHDITQNNLMQGTDQDVASSCYLAKLDFDTEATNDVYHSLTDWISFGNAGKLETCSAVAGNAGNDVMVVGSVGDGGLFSDGYPMQGLLALLDHETLGFIDATLIKSAEDPSKKMVYPLDIIHDYGRKIVYVAALTSQDDTSNNVVGNQEMPNWQEQHPFGSAFDVTVIKIHAKDGQKPEAVWVKHFPLEAEADGTTPPVFVAGMALQTDTNGLQHLLVSGSTRGSGEAFGKAAPNTFDEDGFVMQLRLSDGSFVKHDRHEGKIYNYQADLREGTESDDFIRGMCNNHNRGKETNGQSDVFYVVGGTKGDMTTDAQGVQNEMKNSGFQFGKTIQNKYKDSWNREESLQPFLRKVAIDTLGPIWTTQWAAMPPNANSKNKIPTNAYAMDCFVDVNRNAVFVVGSVMDGAIMTQGDVELINQGHDDIWVAKVDETTGNVWWVTQLGSTSSEYLARHGAIAVNNEGNVLIYGDTNGSMYRPRSPDEDDAATDMFVMTIDGKTGAVLDEKYLGGTASAAVQVDTDGPPPTVVTAQPPKKPDTSASAKDQNRISNSDGKSKVGIAFGVLIGLAAALVVLYLIMYRNMKRRKAEAQKSSIFACLQQFDVEDIDLRRSPPGGWHGTYMNKLAYGQNNAEDGGMVESPREGTALTHSSLANDALFMDTKDTNEFSIDDEDDVDIRLNANKIV